MSNSTEKTSKMNDDELYKQNIERLMLTGSTEIISNSLPQHAAALLACFFRNATSEVKILCTSLGREVYDSPEVLSSMLSATRRGIAIQVFVRREPEADSEFLKRFQEEASLRTRKLVLKTDAESQSDLIKRMEGNFAVMDQKAFRWEQDCKKVTAVACMNFPSVAAKLIAMFDRFYNSIRQIEAQRSAA